MSAESRFSSLIPENSLVPAKALLRFFDGKIEPISGKDDADYGYSDSDQAVLASFASYSVDQIKALPSFSTPLWISSAGGPGAGKSTALLRFVAQRIYGGTKELNAHNWAEPMLTRVINTVLPVVPAAFVSADRNSLYNFAEYSAVENVSKFFYSHWRWAMNGLSNLDLSHAFARRTNIIHDTTLAGYSNLPAAKEAGYYTVVVAVASPLESREEAASTRNEFFYQSFPTNVVAQDAAFGEKLPAVVAQADEFFMYWRDAANEAARPVGVIVDNRRFEVFDQNGFDKFTALYPKLAQEILPRLTQGDCESRIPSIAFRQSCEAPKYAANRVLAL